MKYLLGIDIGASGLKAMILSQSGQILISSAVDYRYDSPLPGFAEQDPRVWRDACYRSIINVMRQTDISASDISAVSFSGQVHGVVMLDRDYKAVRPAILHCDTRSVRQAEFLNDSIPSETRQRLFRSPLCSGSVPASLLWVRENEPDNFERIAHVCSPKDYVRFCLTGVFTSEYSEASESLLFDVENNRWSDEIISLTGLPRSIFPDCTESAAVAGTVSKEASALTGLSTDTLAAAGGSGLTMMSIGSGMVNNGDAVLNISDEGQVSFQTDRPVIDPELNTSLFTAYKSGRWILCGASMSAGSCLKWWRNVTGNAFYDRIREAVSKARPGSGGVLFYPYLNGERSPYPMSDISVCFLGVNASAGYGEMTRAIMEGVIYNLRQSAEICGSFGFPAETYLATGGAARSDDWVQIMADIFNKPFKRVIGEEQACLGAALTAGVGAGFWNSIPEAAAAVIRHHDRVFLPDPENAAVYEEYYQVFRDTFPRFSGSLRKLTDLSRSRK